MAWHCVTAKITGIAPLLMHNSQLANPLNEYVKAMKAITAKKNKKTEADIERLAELEFLGGLYLDASGRPCIPGECIEGMIRGGAKKSWQGKDVQSGVISDGNWPLIYDGPKDRESLWNDHNFRDFRTVRVGQNRIMRTRPRFNSWSLQFNIAFDDGILNSSSTYKWLEDAGTYVGLCDGRPRFGRFIVDSVSQPKAM